MGIDESFNNSSGLSKRSVDVLLSYLIHNERKNIYYLMQLIFMVMNFITVISITYLKLDLVMTILLVAADLTVLANVFYYWKRYRVYKQLSEK